MYYDWKPYVPAAERRRKAMREMDKLRKNRQAVSPVVIQGRTIARTFWGKAWCENLERYSDYSNRLPRGRTYVRNGSVLDLQVSAGSVAARVCGSSLYQVKVSVKPVAKAHWKAVCADCSGAIDSLVELLQGRFSNGVMERIYRQQTGLFPAPGEIAFNCSCPDWAAMCKHVAAVLYAIGARLDEKPELLFQLRKVNAQELIAGARDIPLSKKGPASGKVLEEAGLSELFGIDMAARSGVAPKKRQAKPSAAARGNAPARKRGVKAGSARVAGKRNAKSPQSS